MVTKEVITETASRLFAHKGFHETSMENIAEAVGIKKQSLYSHFKSKSDIILSVLRDQADKIKEELGKLLSDHRLMPVENLLKYFFIRIAVYLSQRERLLLWKRIFLYSEEDDLKEVLLNTVFEFDEYIRRSLSQLLTERYPIFSDPAKLSQFFVSYMVIMQGYLDYMLGSGFNSDTAELVWDTYWNGIKPTLSKESD